MSDVLRLSGFALTEGASKLDVSLSRGALMVVMGPAGSGKSRFIECVRGERKPATGSVKRSGSLAVAGVDAPLKRATPLSIAKSAGTASSGARIAEALTALGLWNVRHVPVSRLTPGQVASCDLLAPFVAVADLLAIDGAFDSLDPWAEQATCALLRKRLSRGMSAVLATNRPEWLPRADLILVLADCKPAFCGAYRDLCRAADATELVVETERSESVRSLVDPFALRVNPSNGGLRISAADGQELAAKLLAEGYGDVKAVFVGDPAPARLLELLFKPK